MDGTFKKYDKMRLKHNEINFEVAYEGHQNCSKTYYG